MAAILFCVYAALTGLTFSILLETYTTASVVGAFAGATGVFAGMAFYGYVPSATCRAGARSCSAR